MVAMSGISVVALVSFIALNTVECAEVQLNVE